MPALVDLAPRPTAALSDLDLLRRYEPILRFTVGEEFFPIDVAQYLAHCSLWIHHPSRPDELLVDEGRLTLETLAAPVQPGLARSTTSTLSSRSTSPSTPLSWSPRA
jgi:hypothetical protein